MARREILRMGDPRLRRLAAPVQRADGAVRQLVADLLETLHAAGGLGLAAPQIGVSRRVIVVEVPGSPEGALPETHVLLNPRIVAADRLEPMVEACLSLPGYAGRVRRFGEVRVVGLDPSGCPLEVVGRGLLAQAFQHEIDHLDGVLYIDRAEVLARLAPSENEPGA